ncbi:MAG: polysaccharide export protein [Hyphomicrobiaceae bacterium]|nr:polysaccharide export protein [Hyphomicrobiaceae bacterium]
MSAGLDAPSASDKPSDGALATASLGTRGGAEAPVALPEAAKELASAATPGSSAYKIGPLDLLEISVFKVAELSKSVQVADVGTINFPLVGEVQAAGRTPQEVERDLTKKLGAKYLQSPQVTVLVKEYNSQRVTVEGAVKKPGVYPLRGPTTLLQSIALAEGLDKATASGDIVVFRSTAGKRAAARFEIDAIRSGTSENPTLVAGDVVVVADSAIKTAFSNFMKAIPAAGAFALFF